MQEKPASKVIFSFFGPPGSGKGTLAKNCEKELGFKTLSTGNLFRKHIAAGTDFGKMIDTLISAGKLVPDEFVNDMVLDWLKDKIEAGVSVILDGYPRTKGQADNFLKSLKDFAPDYAFRVVCFIISDENVIGWLTNRFVCSNKACQAIYTSTDAAVERGICDVCGNVVEKRVDDSVEVIKERLRRYPKYRDELLHYYKSVGQKVEIIEVEDKSIEQVFQAFKAML
jgi:adenylate kinase